MSLELVASIPVAPEPVGIAIPLSGREAYVVHEEAALVTVIDIRELEVIAEIPLDLPVRGGRRVAVNRNGRYAVVSTQSEGGAAVVNSGSGASSRRSPSHRTAIRSAWRAAGACRVRRTVDRPSAPRPAAG